MKNETLAALMLILISLLAIPYAPPLAAVCALAGMGLATWNLWRDRD